MLPLIAVFYQGLPLAGTADVRSRSEYTKAACHVACDAEMEYLLNPPSIANPGLLNALIGFLASSTTISRIG